MTIRRTATVAVATLSILAAPGIAQATPGDPGMCSGTGYCQPADPPDNGTLDGASVVWGGPGFWDYARSFVNGVLDYFPW